MNLVGALLAGALLLAMTIFLLCTGPAIHRSASTRTFVLCASPLIALLWTTSLPKSWEGRVLLTLTPTHGVNTSDLLSIPLLAGSLIGLLLELPRVLWIAGMISGLVVSGIPTAQYLTRDRSHWNGTFADGTLAHWTGVQAARPAAVTLVPDPLDPKHGIVARFEVRPGDHTNSADTERAEVVADPWLINASKGKKQQYDWEILFPSTSHPAPGWGLIITQFHQTSTTCPPNVAISLVRGARQGEARLRLSVRGGSLAPTCDATSSASQDLGVLPRDRWVHLQLLADWSPSAGHVELKVAGVGRAALTGANLYRGQSVYLKQGIYRPNDSRTTTLLIRGTAGRDRAGAS